MERSEEEDPQHTIERLCSLSAPLTNQFVKVDLSKKVPTFCKNALTFNIYLSFFLILLAFPLWIIISCSQIKYPFEDLNEEVRSGLIGGASALLGLDVIWLLYSLRLVFRGGLPCTMPSPPPHAPTFPTSASRPAQHVALKHVYIIKNGASGKNYGDKILNDILLPRLHAENITHTVLPTRYPAHAYDYAHNLPLDNVDALIVIGGDGSLMETVTGLLSRPDKRRIPIGLIPGGTGNSFSADAGCWDVAAAVERIIAGQVVSVDANHVRDEGDLDLYSINVVALGLIGDVAVTAETARWLGGARYDACGLWALLKNAKLTMRLEYEDADGQVTVLDRPVVTAFVSHTQYFGKGLRAAPKAALDDGFADITICTDLSRAQMLEVFAQLPLGAHGNQIYDNIIQKPVRRCVMQVRPTDTAADAAPDSVAEGVVNVDGEMFAYRGAITVECVPEAFQLFAPADARAVDARALGGVKM